MKELIAMVQPFVFQQQVYVFEGDAILDQFETSMVEMPDALLDYCEKSRIVRVTLRGDSHFVAKIKQDIEKRELVQYGNNKLQINAL